MPLDPADQMPPALILTRDAGLARAIRAILVQEGYEATTMRTSAEALSTLDGDARRHLVLMDDVHASDEASRFRAELRARPPLRRRVRTVGLTPLAEQARRGHTLLADFDAVVPLPFEPEALLATLAALARTPRYDG